MTKDITRELKDGNDTFGKIAYQKYKITGARGEAQSGFPHVKYVIENFNLINELDKYKVIFYLIANIEDTVLLKRAGSYDIYLSIRKLFNCDVVTYELVNELDNRLKTNKVSFGGAADLLIVCLFLKKLNCIINIL
jgi:triphosphoribosyl-dephospho-CoA synthase